MRIAIPIATMLLLSGCSNTRNLQSERSHTDNSSANTTIQTTIPAPTVSESSSPEALIAISELTPSVIALTCPCADIMDVARIGGRGSFDTSDKPGAIAEFVRAGKIPRSPMPLSESKLLSFWANPKLDTITSLEELLPSDLIMERLQITFNHRTGAIFVDRYRLGRTFFTLVRSTREVVIVTTLNQYGLWQTSEVFHNNGTLDAPVKGHLLRTYRTTVSDDTRDMSGNNYQYQAQETDATTHETRTLVFDSANDFRKIAETYTTVGKAKPLLIEIHYAYSDDFSGGALPSIIQVSVNNKQVAEAKAVSFDPDSRAYVVRTRLLPAGGQEKLQAFQLSQTE